MEKSQFDVIALDSDSEDEIQILSENIPNYGNIAAPVEITPELQEKINSSLEKYVPCQGQIKAIKAYTTSKKDDNSVGTVRACILSTNGQDTQVINMGPASAFFTSPVRGRANNNSRNRVMLEKRFPHSLATDTADVQTARPSSSVILDSPVRKIKIKRFREKQRATLIKPNPSDSASPHPNKSGYCLSNTLSPEIKQSSHNSTPPWFQNLSQSFDDEIVAEDNSKYERTMTKNVKINRKDSLVKDQSESDHSLQTSTTKRRQENSHLNKELSKQKMNKEFSRNNVECTPENNNVKVDPRLSSSTSSPSPTSPPTEAWKNVSTLSQLNPAEFGAVAGLCQVEADTQARKRVNGPKRVLRKRPKKNI